MLTRRTANYPVRHALPTDPMLTRWTANYPVRHALPADPMLTRWTANYPVRHALPANPMLTRRTGAYEVRHAPSAIPMASEGAGPLRRRHPNDARHERRNGCDRDAAPPAGIRPLAGRTTHAASRYLVTQAALAVRCRDIIGRAGDRRLANHPDGPTGLLAGCDNTSSRSLLPLRRRRHSARLTRLLDDGGARTGHRLPFQHATGGLLDRRRWWLGQLRGDLSLEPHHHLVAGREPAIFGAACENVAGLRARPRRSRTILGYPG